MTSALSTDFNGQEGTVAMWVSCLTTDANTTPVDWKLFHVKSKTGSDTMRLDIGITQVGSAKPDALTITYSKANVSSNMIQDSDFTALGSQQIAVAWSYSDTDHELRYYKNGALVATSTDIPQWPATAPTEFEASIGPANHAIRHVALWDVALPTSDILAMYEVGAAGDAVTMDIDKGAFGSTIRFYNPTATRCYVTSLTIRGKRVKRYREAYAEASDDNSRSLYGQSNLEWDMPYETEPEFARLFANWLLNKVANPFTGVESMEFTANASSAIFKRALILEPGDRITIQEDQSGLNSSFHVAGLEYQLQDAENMKVTLYLVSADQTAAWNIGSAGFSEIGETTFLAL